ncbi:RagB/SusD family nutrient uptake outer membrane protein [Tamlana sp. 2201CG12-4]|uniref:RagB/SusD family nutrient uptake outer membrane protein n=1 Tax=Tamlana sp. 2201CG12-4 TaxID=3112582 RepID=UPI002DBE0E46|nr:RagB/SusD family nutrient uptake outer membrane protein [Tamlana sp. 2201CG12-4]MEC3908831.1 RagB/SusD family nutrient uptake outer membrane protein [Tamlana sp. 2201CG12-4]
MKKILNIFVITLIVSVLGSCSSFLDQKPRNIAIVKTVDDYKAILGSYMRWLKNPAFGENPAIKLPGFDVSRVTNIYSGEVSIKQSQIIDNNTGLITNFADTYMNWLSQSTVSTWNKNYIFTGPLNYIIDTVNDSEIPEGIDVEEFFDVANYVKGEALVWRAWTYYNTLRYFAPYKNNDLGIVLSMHYYEDPSEARLARATQLESYNQILSDLNEALELLEETPPNEEWNFAYNKEHIYSMMASIYHFKALSGGAEASDWGNAIIYADMAIDGKVLSSDPDNLKKMFNLNNVTAYQDDQFSWRVAKIGNLTGMAFRSAGYFVNANGQGNSNFAIRPLPADVHVLFAPNDIRTEVYLRPLSGGDLFTMDKYSLAGANRQNRGVIVPFRLADLYLIKAEAMARQGIADASGVLQDFLNARYTGDIPVIPGEPEVLLTEILRQRRIEFFQENGMRWLEMKRLNLTFDRGVIGGRSLVLESDDFRYAWPIPGTELGPESDVIQNPGWESIISVNF